MLRSRSILPSFAIISVLVILAVPLCSRFHSTAEYGLVFPPLHPSLDLNHIFLRLPRLLTKQCLNRSAGSFLVRRLFEDVSETQFNSSSAATSKSTLSSARSSLPIPVPPTLIQKLDINFTSSASNISLPSNTIDPGSAAQPPALSTTLLVLLTGGALLLLSILAVASYCCVRFRRRRQSRKLALKEAAREMDVTGSSRKKERGRWADDLEGGRGKGFGLGSPSAFEFSPPSPTWRPILPSLTFVSGNGGGHAQISNAEAIMRECERGRWNGGSGWLHGVSASGSAESNVRHPPPSAYVSTSRGKAGVTVAPPLPTIAPQAYRPPAYHRPSRIIPVPDAVPKVAPTPLPTRAKSTRSVHFAPPPPVPRAPTVTVPRIQVHPAQDGPAHFAQRQAPTHADARSAQHEAAATGSKAGNDGAGVKRRDSAKGGRPVSGLGISTIDLTLNGENAASSSVQVNTCSPYLVAQHSVATRKLPITLSIESSSRDRSDNKQRPSGSDGSVVSHRPSSLASNEDIRLAYTISASSIGSAANFELGASMGEARQTDEVVARKAGNEHDAASVALAAQKPDMKSTAAMTTVKATLSENKDTFVPLVASTYSDSEASILTSQLREIPTSLTRSLSSKRANPSRRQGLGTGTIDESAKRELYAMRSLGSESFDSLIAYLEETVEPSDGGERNAVVAKPRQKQRAVEAGRRQENRFNDEMGSPRITREDTARVDKEAYEAWVGGLNTSPSVLRLAHVNISSNPASEPQISGRSGRKSRSFSRSGAGKTEAEAGSGVGIRASKPEADSIVRVALRECDTNRDSQKMRDQNENERGAHAARSSAHEKVGMHVRALRARSASLKLKSQAKGNSEVVLENVPGDATRDGLSVVNAIAARPPSGKDVPRVENEKEKQPARLLISVSSQPLSALPSFSIPSSATQLYASFPLSEASSSASLSDSSIIRASVNARHSRAPTKIPATPSYSISASISTAAYIARCAPTPHAKSSATLPFLSPSPTLVHRMSTGSMSSMESNTSTWGRRSEWGRESLTPRFDHLRAVLEGRFEDPPPLPTENDLHGERVVLDCGQPFPSASRLGRFNR